MPTITLTRETLLRPLKFVMGVVEKKQMMPILSHVLLHVNNKQLSMTATDLDIELVAHHRLPDNDHTNTNQQLTVPARKLNDICQALPENADINIDISKNKIKLQSENSQFILMTLPVKNFPKFKQQESPTNLTCQLPSKSFKHLLQRTGFSMGHQDVRHYLNGLLLEAYPNVLLAVATDGHRLAKNTLSTIMELKTPLQTIIPRKTITELLRLLPEDESIIHLTLKQGQLSLSNENFTLTSKVIEGAFPDYKNVIPTGLNKQLMIDRDILKQALLRSIILCGEKFKGIRLELTSQWMRILTHKPQHEMAEEKLHIDYHQDDFDIGFNAAYLLDILNTLDPGNITLSFSSANNSVLIKEENDQWASDFVVMPIQL